MIQHQMVSINRERMSMLDDALKQAKGGTLPLADIIEALVMPLARRFVLSTKGQKRFTSGLSRWFSQSAETKQKVNSEVFAEVADRFHFEIQRTLPEVLAEDIVRRFYVAGSALLGGFMRLDQFLDLRSENLDEPVIWETVKELKEFICAGLGRPIPKVEQDRIVLRQGNTQRVVDTRAICSIRADDNYTHVIYWGGGKSYVRRTMSQWEHILSSDQFIRIHRSVIINRIHISEIKILSDERLRIQLQGDSDPHFVSRRRAPRVKRILAL